MRYLGLRRTAESTSKQKTNPLALPKTMTATNPFQILIEAPADDSFVEVTFPYHTITHNDVSGFLKTFSWERLHDPALLRRLHGRVRFRFEFFTQDPAGFERLPVMRTFLQDWHHAWPAWFFFADLSEEVPLRMALACLPNLLFVARDGERRQRVAYHKPDMLTFLSGEWLFLQTMAMQAHLGFPAAAARARAVWDYLELPPNEFPAHRWPTYATV